MQMAGQLADELMAVAAVGEVLFYLQGLILVGEARRIPLQERLAVLAPPALFDQPELPRQLIDAPGYLLAVGPGREPLDHAADLAWVQAPPVAEEHHGASPGRQAGEQIARDARALLRGDRILRRPCRIRDRPCGLQRGDRLAATAPQLLARVVRDRGEQVAADLLIREVLMAPLESAESSKPRARVDVIDLVVAECRAVRAPDHGRGGPAKLLVEPARAAMPIGARAVCRRNRPVDTDGTPGTHASASLGTPSAACPPLHPSTCAQKLETAAGTGYSEVRWASQIARSSSARAVDHGPPTGVEPPTACLTTA